MLGRINIKQVTESTLERAGFRQNCDKLEAGCICPCFSLLSFLTKVNLSECREYQAVVMFQIQC